MSQGMMVVAAVVVFFFLVAVLPRRRPTRWRVVTSEDSRDDLKSMASLTDSQLTLIEGHVADAYKQGLTEAPMFNWRGVRPRPERRKLARSVIWWSLFPLIAVGYLCRWFLLLCVMLFEITIWAVVGDEGVGPKDHWLSWSGMSEWSRWFLLTFGGWEGNLKYATAPSEEL